MTIVALLTFRSILDPDKQLVRCLPHQAEPQTFSEQIVIGRPAPDNLLSGEKEISEIQVYLRNDSSTYSFVALPPKQPEKRAQKRTPLPRWDYPPIGEHSIGSLSDERALESGDDSRSHESLYVSGNLGKQWNLGKPSSTSDDLQEPLIEGKFRG